MKSTQYLIQEHKVILRALDVLDAMGTVAENGNTLDPDDVDKILEFLRWFADAHHQAKEETILFPAMRTAAAAQARAIEHILFEHTQDRVLIEAMEGAVRLGNISEFVAHAYRLSSMLRNHIYKEDSNLFETANGLLDTQVDDELLERLNRFETALDKEILGEKLKDLRSLEWKYLRK